MHYPLISKNFLTGLNELLRAQGIAPEPLFELVGLAPDAINQPDGLIPLDKHNQLLLLSAEKLRCPHLGLSLARQQGPFVFSPLTNLIQRCKNIGEALTIFSKHLSMVVQTVDVQLLTKGDLAYLDIRGRFEPVARSATFQDHALALAHDMLKSFCGADWLPRSAYFQHPEPSNSKPYSEFFRCPIGFNHHTLGLVLDRQLLKRPIHQDTKTTHHYLAQAQHLNAQVREVISATLATEECHLDNVAQILGLSARTLQRRLSQHNTSFSQLIDDVRYRQSIVYLSTPFYRLTDVAAMLGYSELSAFSRSFKRWHGVTPLAFRQHQRAASTVLYT